MIQKATAMGNWWLAASSQQHACSCISSHAESVGETSNHSGDSAPLEPRFGALQLLDFPKTKITFEREEISDHWWDSGWQGSWWQLGELWEVPRCLLWRGLRHHCLIHNVSCIFFNKCLYFSYYMARYLLDRLCILCVCGGQVIEHIMVYSLVWSSITVINTL